MKTNKKKMCLTIHDNFNGHGPALFAMTEEQFARNFASSSTRRILVPASSCSFEKKILVAAGLKYHVFVDGSCSLLA